MSGGVSIQFTIPADVFPVLVLLDVPSDPLSELAPTAVSVASPTAVADSRPTVGSAQ